MFTISEIAKKAQVSVMSVYRYLDKNKISTHKNENGAKVVDGLIAQKIIQHFNPETTDVQKYKRTINHLQDLIKEKDARITDLKENNQSLTHLLDQQQQLMLVNTTVQKQLVESFDQQSTSHQPVRSNRWFSNWFHRNPKNNYLS
jgi:predicted RNase H-like nuclease (RuvC/YqgF family)